MTQKVGHAAGVYAATMSALISLSVSVDSQTKRSANGANAGSVKITVFIDRQVWHHGAHWSITSGRFFALAHALAAAASSSYQWIEPVTSVASLQLAFEVGAGSDFDFSFAQPANSSTRRIARRGNIPGLIARMPRID
jgi:hypothetical protein